MEIYLLKENSNMERKKKHTLIEYTANQPVLELLLRRACALPAEHLDLVQF